MQQSSGVSVDPQNGDPVISPLSGFSMAESSYSQPQFSTVQQLQDSSTLESQALSSSYHQPNLLHVSTAEVVSPTHPDPVDLRRGEEGQ